MQAYKFKSLTQQKDITHGISTREFGSVKKEDSSINMANLENFLTNLNLPPQGICMEQVHSTNVSEVENNDRFLIPNSDGLITNQKNIPLCVVTADCLPILFFDYEKKIIGVGHGGRKGLLAGIIKNVVEKFKKDYNSDPANIIVGIGPGIEKKCYEVDGQLMDLRKMAHEMLLEEGVRVENIEDLDMCTKCNKDLFYSYRGGDNLQRFVTVISLI
ncbi:MAG TPA: polyphenol oxidase family protein [Xanthomonadales bacterium]|nr:polyphenol oxidase family protein [Xanthomonadales bacterium]